MPEPMHEPTHEGTVGMRRHPGLAAVALAAALATAFAVHPARADLVLMEAGIFPLGDDAGTPEERPAHRVDLPAFWLDRTEVPVSLYRRCVRVGACRAPKSGPGFTYRDEGADDLPVTGVTWEDARALCAWRGARLPTEAEWERAAAGLLSRPYPWGDAPPDCERVALRGRDRDCARERPLPVGSRPAGATPEGLLDMSGNVAEWVADWYGRYQADLLSRPTGPEEGRQRVTRGGSFRVHQRRYLRAAARRPEEPEQRLPTVGFRCARDRSRR